LNALNHKGLRQSGDIIQVRELHKRAAGWEYESKPQRQTIAFFAVISNISFPKYLFLFVSCEQAMQFSKRQLTFDCDILLRFALIFCLTRMVGCSKEELNKMVENVQTKTSSVVKETIAKVVPMGSVQLSLDEGIEVPICSARLLNLGGGRTSILQIRSYGDDDRDAVKSVLFQGKTSAASIQELVGQTVTGQLFAQSDKETGLWQSDSEGPSSIKILALQDTELVGEILQSKMVRVDGKSGYPSGSFRAVIVKP